ncbi:hypothetical protein Q427_31740 [Halomonas sp. BC04]|nr:hypothetical protein Q427_31740 [Halomonas sp. BC04]
MTILSKHEKRMILNSLHRWQAPDFLVYVRLIYQLMKLFTK